MVGVVVGDVDLVHLHEADRAMHLALRSLAAVEQQPLASHPCEQAGGGSTRGGHRAAGAEEYDREVHAPTVSPLLSGRGDARRGGRRSCAGRSPPAPNWMSPVSPVKPRSWSIPTSRPRAAQRGQQGESPPKRGCLVSRRFGKRCWTAKACSRRSIRTTGCQSLSSVPSPARRNVRYVRARSLGARGLSPVGNVTPAEALSQANGRREAGKAFPARAWSCTTEVRLGARRRP